MNVYSLDPGVVSGESWQDRNQRHLGTELGRVRALLEAFLTRTSTRSAPKGRNAQACQFAPEPGSEWPGDLPRPALERLGTALGLSSFERQVLLMCAGFELDASFASLVETRAGESGNTQPIFSLALAALPDSHWSALAPESPLRYWRLIEVQPGATLVTSGLRVDERILHFLTGVESAEERLEMLLAPVDAPPSLPATQESLASRLAQLWTARESQWPCFQLCGDADIGVRDVAAWACTELGLQLYSMDAADVPADAHARELLARLWERETCLRDVALLIETWDRDSVELSRAVRFIERLRVPLVVAGRDPLRSTRRAMLRLDVVRPGAAEQREMWQDALGEIADRLNGQLREVISQFNLAPQAIREVSAAVSWEPMPTEDASATLWDACRAQSRTRLDDLAQRIEPGADWENLVLPETQLKILRDVVAQARHRSQVYESWGFAARCPRGLGIAALFAGPSGTGKTLAAEVLARQLRLDLYRVDLSAVVSKYIGETEKNLRRVFDAAEAGGAVLLFDEADALFGRRSEVKDSHDRYANIEVSYLLQRMESYRGLAILTTNQKQALDGAFLRRLRFVVTFPFPDAAQRFEIWRQMFPPNTPIEGLNFDALARLNIAGGNIRNIALHSAFLAADANEPVRMSHLLQAARAEYAKLERPLSDAELGGWQ